MSNLIAVNPLARHELWIISDSDSADKMLRLHELRNLASTDKNFEQWYIFKNFDLFTQTPKPFVNALVELEMGLHKTLQTRKRLPHSIVFILGDSLLEDDKLNQYQLHLRQVLSEMCKQLKKQMVKWITLLPHKATPTHNVQFFINKPIPKPEAPYLRLNNMDTFQSMSTRRNVYNSQLIKAVHDQGFKFINPGISSKDAKLFEHVKSNTYKLSPQGLTVFWETLSDSLDKLHGNSSPPLQTNWKPKPESQRLVTFRNMTGPNRFTHRARGRARYHNNYSTTY